jgi:dipeptidase D
VAEQGRALGCEVELDAVGNVLLRKGAAPGQERRSTVALQAHADMVCEKNEGTPHDFERDPIDAHADGDFVRARGTTLGADNGVGLAAALALLADRDLRHGPLEVLVTVDEETGLTGAKAIRPGWLRAQVLLNLDSEEQGELTIGCAGGLDSVATRRVTRVSPPPGARALRFKVGGLKGGHSGTDIAAGRGNAVRLLGHALDALSAPTRFEIELVHGGNKRNAIPREAWAVLHVDPSQEAVVRGEARRQQEAWRAALGAFDPGLTMEVESASGGAPLSAPDARAVTGLLLAAPHGAEAMSPDMAGLVQTSTNFAAVETSSDMISATFLTRSVIDASKAALAARIARVCALAGFDVREGAGYPGWKPAPSAPIVELVQGVHAELFGKPMLVRAIHAGLECGLIGEKYPGMQMVSLGPTILDAHTPDERVNVPSVLSFWTLLRGVVERI